MTDTYIYDAFGNLLTKTGTTANDFLYTGEQYDANTGFYYLHARYMNPSTGTFTSMDAYAGTVFDPVSLHKYLYANANLVMNRDPSGYLTVGDLLGGMAIQAIIGAAFGSLTSSLMSMLFYDTHGGDMQSPERIQVAWEGFWKGALLGAAGGAFFGGLAILGTEFILANVMSGLLLYSNAKRAILTLESVRSVRKRISMFRESDVMELKQELTPDTKKEIVAFANTKGGVIYIGIDDDGNVSGVEKPERICERLSSMIHDGIRPDISMFTNIISENIDGKNVVKIIVQRGSKRPYYLSDNGLKSSGVYIRLGNTSVPATENAIRSMIAETDDVSFEKMRSIRQELTFDSAETEFSKQKLDFGKAQQKTLGIMDADDLFTNLGLLLSDQCQHSIKAAVFKGIEKDEFLTRKEFDGSLFMQLADVYSFIDLNNQLHSTFEGLSRIDRRDYSESAIREALLNAIIHRDYSFSGSTLVSVFSDRLEIVSLGGLVPGLEPEDIFEGISQTRNVGLANIFYRLNYIEAYGTGIRKIRKECETMGVSADFRITNAAFRVIIPNRNVSHSEVLDMDPELSAALNYIRLHSVASRKELQEVLGIKQTKCGLLLKALKEKGLIVQKGSGKATRYMAIR